MCVRMCICVSTFDMYCICVCMCMCMCMCTCACMLILKIRFHTCLHKLMERVMLEALDVQVEHMLCSGYRFSLEDSPM